MPVRVALFMPRIEHMDAPAMPLIIMLMVHMAVAISTRLRLKAFTDPMHMAAEPFDHRLQHMVGQQPQPAGPDLNRHMAIADVIRDPGQLQRIVGMHFEQVFGGRLDCDHTAIGQQQSIAVAQQRAGGQVNTDGLARQQLGSESGAFTLLEGQFDHLVGGTPCRRQGLRHCDCHLDAPFRRGNSAAPSAGWSRVRRSATVRLHAPRRSRHRPPSPAYSR